jgi:hypothetical protein
MTDGIHKARPQDEALGVSACAVCAAPVQRVPGGHGPVWVHTETGTVTGLGQDTGVVPKFYVFDLTGDDPPQLTGDGIGPFDTADDAITHGTEHLAEWHSWCVGRVTIVHTHNVALDIEEPDGAR